MSTLPTVPAESRLAPKRKLEQRSKEGRVLWECDCRCGGSAIVSTTDLRLGRVRSCGCLAREISAQAIADRNRAIRRAYARRVTERSVQREPYPGLTVNEFAWDRRGAA